MRVVDLGALGWGNIHVESSGSVVLGATVRLQTLVDDAVLSLLAGGVLAEAAKRAHPSWMIRNVATIAGESLDEGSVLSLVLRSLGAEPVLQGKVVKEIRLDLSRQQVGAFETVSVLPTSRPLAAAAVSVTVSGHAVVSIPGCTYEGRLDRVDEAVERAAREVRPLGDRTMSEEFLRHVVGVLVRRALEQARARAGSRKPLQPYRRCERRWTIPVECKENKIALVLTINGGRFSFSVSPQDTLMALLRRERWTSVKHGCETGDCGVCAVLINGEPVNSCILLAGQAQGCSIETVEALGEPGRLHPLQEAFMECGAVQCGYCTPSMLLCSKALLARSHQPSEGEVREALAGTLCRCTGYVKPVEAVLRAVERGRT
jgi:aerobic-type carbon monoxide dehydrogenase small subunit (CoxS/CutS family)